MSRIKRQGLSKALRFQILERDQFSCHYCGATPPAVRLEVDHIFPFSHGGGNESWNLAAACEACNAGKMAREVDCFPDWYDLFEELGQLRWWIAREMPEADRTPWLNRRMADSGEVEGRFAKRLELFRRRVNPEGV